MPKTPHKREEVKLEPPECVDEPDEILPDRESVNDSDDLDDIGEESDEKNVKSDVKGIFSANNKDLSATKPLHYRKDYRWKEGKIEQKGSSSDEDEDEDGQELNRNEEDFEEINAWLDEKVKESRVDDPDEEFLYHCVLCEDKKNQAKGKFTSDIKKHIQKKHITLRRKHIIQRTFTCPEEGCGAEFISDRSRRLHIRWKHTDGGGFPCSVCGSKFVCKSTLLCHENIHRTEDKVMYACSECGSETASPTALQLHIKSHKALAVYTKRRHNECRFCKTVFIHLNKRENHIIEEHGENLPWLVKKRQEEEDCLRRTMDLVSINPNPLPRDILRTLNIQVEHMCDECGKGFSVRRNLMQHKIKVHKFVEVEKGVLYKCKFCEESFKFGEKEAHMITDHPFELNWLATILTSKARILQSVYGLDLIGALTGKPGHNLSRKRPRNDGPSTQEVESPGQTVKKKRKLFNATKELEIFDESPAAETAERQASVSSTYDDVYSDVLKNLQVASPHSQRKKKTKETFDQTDTDSEKENQNNSSVSNIEPKLEPSDPVAKVKKGKKRKRNHIGDLNDLAEMGQERKSEEMMITSNSEITNVGNVPSSPAKKKKKKKHKERNDNAAETNIHSETETFDSESPAKKKKKKKEKDKKDQVEDVSVRTENSQESEQIHHSAANTEQEENVDLDSTETCDILSPTTDKKKKKNKKKKDKILDASSHSENKQEFQKVYEQYLKEKSVPCNETDVETLVSEACDSLSPTKNKKKKKKKHKERQDSDIETVIHSEDSEKTEKAEKKKSDGKKKKKDADIPENVPQIDSSLTELKKKNKKKKKGKEDTNNSVIELEEEKENRHIEKSKKKKKKEIFDEDDTDFAVNISPLDEGKKNHKKEKKKKDKKSKDCKEDTNNSIIEADEEKENELYKVKKKKKKKKKDNTHEEDTDFAASISPLKESKKKNTDVETPLENEENTAEHGATIPKKKKKKKDKERKDTLDLLNNNDHKKTCTISTDVSLELNVPATSSAAKKKKDCLDVENPENSYSIEKKKKKKKKKHFDSSPIAS